MKLLAYFKIKAVIVTVALLSLSMSLCGQVACDCKNVLLSGEKSDYEDLGSIINRSGHKLNVCGFKKEGDKGEDSTSADLTWLYNLHSDFVVHDCQTGENLFVRESNADDWYMIEVAKTSIIITSVSFFNITGFEYKDAPQPVNRIDIRFDGNKAVVSDPLPVFRMPAFSPLVLDSAKRFYERIESAIKVNHLPTEWIDYNQYPNDLLLIAALNHIGRADEIYRNLKDYFELDGALAEDYSSEYLAYLLASLPKK